MKVVRQGVFETNSSSTHSLSIRPIVGTDNTKFFTEQLKIKYGAIVLPHVIDIEYGTMVTLYEKLKYVVALMLSVHQDLLNRSDTWDLEFDCYAANKMLIEKYPDFIKKVTDYVSGITGKPCDRISFIIAGADERGRGEVSIDHGAVEMAFDRNGKEKPDFGFGMDPADVVITNGIQIEYEFS